MLTSFRNNTISAVLAFLYEHWKRERKAVLAIAAWMAVATVADLFLPVFSGRMIDAITPQVAAQEHALHNALLAVVGMAVLGAVLIGSRHLAFRVTSGLTTRTMSRIASDAFWRVQRFSTDWHANTFAGSTVRRITRGMWAMDLMNDTVLLALLPAFLVLIGASLILGAHWVSMGLLVGTVAVIYVAVSIVLSLGYVAPAARLANAQDTRLGAALADSVTCNAVVKAFGAESREDARLDRVLNKWKARTYRDWIFGTRRGTLQMVILLGLRLLIILYALLLWHRGAASLGDVTFVLTSYFIMHGYLRDVGQHVANFQRSVNEMEEMVQFKREPLGIEDRPQAQPLQVSPTVAVRSAGPIAALVVVELRFGLVFAPPPGPSENKRLFHGFLPHQPPQQVPDLRHAQSH